MDDKKQRGRLAKAMGAADEFIDPDKRSFKQQMQELGVEVITVEKKDVDITWVGPKEDPAKLAEAAELIKAAGTEGRVSPSMVLRFPKAQIEDLINKGMTIKEIAENLGIGIATVSALRQTYGITSRGTKKPKKQPQKEAAESVEGELLSIKTIRSTANAAGGEVLGTAKMLERLGDLPVVVEIKVTEDLSE